MKRITFDRFGPPAQVVSCVECDEPGPPASWEIGVRMDAFPINPADLAMVQGQYGILPKPMTTIGMEGVGTVAEKGSAVDTLEIGDRVLLLANNNWATYRKIPATLAVKVPRELDVKQLATLKVSGMTALMLLANTESLGLGQHVIQNAPLSTVGRFVIQISKYLNYKTISIVRRSSDAEGVKSLGCDVVLVDDTSAAHSLRKQIGGATVKLAIDAVAGPATQRLAECLSEGGTVLNYGMLSLQPCQIDASQIIFRNINLKGFWLSKLLNKLSATERENRILQLVALLQDGILCGAVDSVFPIDQIKAAIQRAEQPGRAGKVLIQIA